MKLALSALIATSPIILIVLGFWYLAGWKISLFFFGGIALFLLFIGIFVWAINNIDKYFEEKRWEKARRDYDY